ncbi:hypothetical protein Sango_2495500 [Sesamum angolense]|uniref:Uncharacterized protein n=1 Tax=Sesamum angolense TaxID=2727404 RepID=A0AAE1W3W4_9LAMI|nr:hypothetical protein Sango_2495500 [Sesamum angolense]
MTPELETLTIEFLRENNDMFAQSSSDFQGIGPKIIMHRINMDPQVQQIKQKKRTFGVEMNKIIEEEVNKLLERGFVYEIQYTNWLSNVVIVPKVSGNWCYLPKSGEQDVQRPNRKNEVESYKCTFGVRGGNFLEYMVSEKGIEANPEKIEAIMLLGLPKMVKDVQKLTGKIASLNCFTGPGGFEIEIAIKLSFSTTNNEVEYETLIMGLRITWDGGVKDLDVYTDSQLVAMQIEEVYETRELSMMQYLKKALTEIHEGNYGNHSVGRTLAQKVLKQGYFCPTMVEDAKEFSKKCESCQKFATTSHVPTTPMESIKITCPFDQWGIDIVGPFPLAVA